jgi:DNA polymerase V
MEQKPKTVNLTILKPETESNAPVQVEGFVTAGFPSPANDYLEKELNFNELFVRNPSSTFFVEVSGNSMVDAGIHNGDILVVDRSIDPYDDSIVVCFIDGEFTVKKVNKIDGEYYLIPQNPAFKPIRIVEGSDFRLWGIVTFVIHKFR